MRTLVHLSDLHFGCADPRLLRPLIETVERIDPDLVAVSGDLTQRARSRQFQAARAFLEALPAPRIVVPGNHDIPLHNVFARALRPLAKYRRYINEDVEPLFTDDEIAVIGVNTARSLTIKGGRINATQIARVRECFSALPGAVTKIVVTHHPFDLDLGRVRGTRDIVGRAQLAMRTFALSAVDILLAGHLHTGYLGSTAERYASPGHAALVVQAGTATSTRARGEPNSFNVIRIDRLCVTVEAWSWNPVAARFAAAAPRRFRRDGGRWTAWQDPGT